MTDQPNQVQPIAKTESTEIERLLATGERLLRHQKSRLVAEKAQYESARTGALNHYKEQISKIESDTADELLVLQREHEHRVHEIERLIAKLTAMREA